MVLYDYIQSKSITFFIYIEDLEPTKEEEIIQKFSQEVIARSLEKLMSLDKTSYSYLQKVLNEPNVKIDQKDLLKRYPQLDKIIQFESYLIKIEYFISFLKNIKKNIQVFSIIDKEKKDYISLVDYITNLLNSDPFVDLKEKEISDLDNILNYSKKLGYIK